MSKTERQTEVEALTAELAASPNLYVTDFRGLNVQRMTEFRRRLRGAGARYVVVKNTLAQRALAANKITGLDEFLAGAGVRSGKVDYADPDMSLVAGWCRCHFKKSTTT